MMRLSRRVKLLSDLATNPSFGQLIPFSSVKKLFKQFLQKKEKINKKQNINEKDYKSENDYERD